MTTTIPKVCTWPTFYYRAWDAGLIEHEFENVLGNIKPRVEAQAKAEGLTLYTFNKDTTRGTAAGTYRYVKQDRAFWYDLFTRAGVNFTGELT
jgi:hypothetical protein